MKRLYVHLLILIWAFICFLTPGIVYAQSRSNIDVALVMDSSGSMKKTDPQSLRIPAAKLFISLLDSNDRAAVLSFSDQGYPISGLTPLHNDANKKKLLHAADRITSNGLHTNLYGAFQKGMEVLLEAQDEGREQIIILMSDGMMDVGDHEKDRQLLAKLTTELAGEIKKNSIKVYAIAFTEQSDRRLLEKLSKQTGGFYNLALTDRDFHLIFTSIFESLKSPEMLPMEKNSFLIDGSIQEVTVVVSKESAATDIQINAPDGQQYSGDRRSSGISWFASDNFDMITVKRPVEGRWEILYSTGKDNKAYIITDLKLETNFQQLYAVFGETLDITAWLEKEGAVIKDGEVLETTDIYMELSNPDGNISHLKPLNGGDGIFHKNIIPFKDGNYNLRVIAKGRTYEREKAFLFNVANLQESKEDLKAAREARKHDQAHAQQQSEGKEQAPVNWAKILIQFIAINLILGLLIVAYMKRQSIKDFPLFGRFFKRSQNTEPSKTDMKETGESTPKAEAVEGTSTEKEASGTAETRKAQAAPDDMSSDAKAPEQENPNMDNEPAMESDMPKEAEIEEDRSDDTGDGGTLDTLEEEIRRLEKLKQQDTENQAIPTGRDAASETGEPEKSNTGDTGVSAKSGEDNTARNVEEQTTDEQAHAPQLNTQSAVETTDDEPAVEETKDGEDSVDDMWADAMNEQATSEKREENPAPEGVQETHEAHASIPEEIKDETDDSGEEEIADMWAAALDEQAQEKESSEITPKADAVPSEAVTVPAEEDSDKDADQMWAEALSEQAAADASDEKESDSDTKQEDTPGASS